MFFFCMMKVLYHLFFTMEHILICSYDSQLIPQKKTAEAMCFDIMNAEDFTITP